MSKGETPNSKEGIEILEGIENWSDSPSVSATTRPARRSQKPSRAKLSFSPGLEDDEVTTRVENNAKLIKIILTHVTKDIRAEIADAGPESTCHGSAQYIANLRKALKKHTWKTTDTPTAYINRGKSMFDALNEAKSCEFTNELQLCQHLVIRLRKSGNKLWTAARCDILGAHSTYEALKII
ncbi:hypothetical protein BC829DRAFT_448829 [Chytridium lagenaria]|nr:hypothetical protein BC829DRAFT_448829 [Chytridium lagenaria]